MNNIKAYAGIGTRSNDLVEAAIMNSIAEHLRESHVLYTGAASGSDQAFMHTAGGSCVLMLPWNGFNDAQKDILPLDFVIPTNDHGEHYRAAVASIDKLHPAPHHLSSGGRLLMLRNYYQVMGLPGKWPVVDFVVCNADIDIKAGGVAGGTGQAVRIAIAHKIPVYNIRTRQWIFGSHPVLDEILKNL